ncbi:DUF5994 family protein [Amycolatopsis sp. NPDC048633]|uniref:DUF5994 family protein n=1 Tax=Amycolatopsis sp. NPDC048633 TaxID=3157095 RepID=UPI0033E753B9
MKLKPAAPATGHVDGAWWPHARDLAAELPALLAELGTRLGRIDRVTYQLGEWQAPDRRLTVGEHVVRLEGFRSQRADSVTVVAWDRSLLTLLVVPPETDPDTAQQALTKAAAEGNTEDSAQLLATRGTEHSKAEDGVPQPA